MGCIGKTPKTMAAMENLRRYAWLLPKKDQDQLHSWVQEGLHNVRKHAHSEKPMLLDDPVGADVSSASSSAGIAGNAAKEDHSEDAGSKMTDAEAKKVAIKKRIASLFQGTKRKQPSPWGVDLN